MEKASAQWKHQVMQLGMSVAEAEVKRLLLLSRQAHICSHWDDGAGTKGLGTHEGEYMLVI